MSKELREAAKLLVSKNTVSNRYDNAGVMLAKAYLTEHFLDEGEEVKKHWLHETVDEKDRWLMWQGPKMLVYLKAKESHGIAWVLAGPTRGDVRRLCKALGIELKEKS